MTVRENEPLVTIEVTVLRATEKALLCKTGKGAEVWVARNQISSGVTEVGKRGNLTITQWLAAQKPELCAAQDTAGPGQDTAVVGDPKAIVRMLITRIAEDSAYLKRILGCG
jgi:hypothetical protein